MLLFKRLIPAIAALAALATPIAAQVPAALNPAQPMVATAEAPPPANPPQTPALTKTDVDAWLETQGLSGQLRAEAIDVGEFIALAQALRTRFPVLGDEGEGPSDD